MYYVGVVGWVGLIGYGYWDVDDDVEFGGCMFVDFDCVGCGFGVGGG